MAHGEVQVSFEVMPGEKLQVSLDGAIGVGREDFSTPGEVEGEVFVVEAAKGGGMGHVESG